MGRSTSIRAELQQRRSCGTKGREYPAQKAEQQSELDAREDLLWTDIEVEDNLREAAAKDPANFDPRHFNKPARQYMKQVCLDRYQQFWCAGNASKIKQRDINYYAGLYAKGELDPKTAVAA